MVKPAGVSEHVNVGLRFGSEGPVDAGDVNSRGVRDSLGNVWEWCDQEYKHLDGWKGVHVAYDDYSEPCEDGRKGSGFWLLEEQQQSRDRRRICST